MRAYLLKLFLILIVCFSLVGCTSLETGKYINNKNDSEFINLQEGMKFILFESGMKVQGQYSLDGTQLLLKFQLNQHDYTVKAKLDNNEISDREGQVWVKTKPILLIIISITAALIALILIILSEKITNRYLRVSTQVISIFIGLVLIVPFAESPYQARAIGGKYYFYTLIITAILYKFFSNRK